MTDRPDTRAIAPKPGRTTLGGPDLERTSSDINRVGQCLLMRILAALLADGHRLLRSLRIRATTLAGQALDTVPASRRWFHPAPTWTVPTARRSEMAPRGNVDMSLSPIRDRQASAEESTYVPAMLVSASPTEPRPPGRVATRCHTRSWSSARGRRSKLRGSA